MNDTRRIEEDLEYVRGAVARSERPGGPRSIYWFWAVVVLVGFPLADLAPDLVGWYWAVLGPVGGLISARLGWKHARATGQADRDLGHRHMLHWTGLMVVIFASVVMGIAGRVSWDAVDLMIVLLLTLSYFLAGVHLDRRMMWGAGAMLAAYFLALALPAWGWTVSGVVVATGLVIAGTSGGGARVAVPQ